MEKKIPIYFDTIVLDSPAQEIPMSSGPELGNGSRLKVAVFTKYKNRNGSYITDEYAEYLIKSATRGDTPVVGFFDPETQSWASHTGPTLANGYGYVESFLGWEPITDTDGVTRDYAIFSVVLFSKYWEEARKIAGQNQSMELNIATIEGDWAEFDNKEYFVYTKGDMLGLCVIGQHEPCFSVSHFFSKNDDAYKSQYEKFSSLLFNLRAQVEEAENNVKGGENKMEELENKELENPTPAEEPKEEEKPVAEEFEKQEEEKVEEPEVEEKKEEEETPAEPTEFEVLQQKFEDLQNSYNDLQAKFTEAEETISKLEEEKATKVAEFEALSAEKSELLTKIANYEAAERQAEEVKKNELIEKYEKVLVEEEIKPIKEMVKDFSYDELKSKLAITFADKQLTGSEEVKKVPLPEQEESQFALLMKKYRKN